MHLLFVLFDFTIVFCFAWDDYVASFCNSPFCHLNLYPFCDELETGLGQLLTDLLDLSMIAGLKRQFEEAAGDGHVGVGTVVEDGHHVAAAAGDDLSDLLQLAGFVLECDGQVCLAAAHDQTAGDDAVEDVHIDVAAGDKADDLFALDGQLVE